MGIFVIINSLQWDHGPKTSHGCLLFNISSAGLIQKLFRHRQNQNPEVRTQDEEINKEIHSPNEVTLIVMVINVSCCVNQHLFGVDRECLLGEMGICHYLKHLLHGTPEIFWLLGSQMVHSNAILDHCTPINLPPPLQKKTFPSDLHWSQSWVVLGVGKKSEIILKSENFDPRMCTIPTL